MRAVILTFSMATLSWSVPAQTAAHPLDGLSATELWTAVRALRAAGHVDSTTRFLYAGLREPPKSTVLAWQPGTAFQREATVHFYRGGKGYEAVVDVRGGTVVQAKEVTDRQFMSMRSEDNIAAALFADTRLQEALKRRGLTDRCRR